MTALPEVSLHQGGDWQCAGIGQAILASED